MSRHPRIDLIAGARPNFMKVAPILRALERHAGEGGALRFRLVHTGQHHDHAMSGAFFEQLGIPAPDIHLGATRGTPAAQTGAIMVAYEALLAQAPAALTLVVGDVTSTLACALSARKANIPVAHVEAGIRSGDDAMPEEINRRATDAVSTLFFTTSETAGANLRREGVPLARIHFAGNTMIDTLLAALPHLCPSAAWDALALRPGQYLVLTVHRPANVDAPDNLSRILQAVAANACGLPVVFPVHPRTARTLAQCVVPQGIHLVPPQPYREFNHLIRHSKAAITDSGGVSEETTVLGIPCMTLRDTTERPETVTLGTNELLGSDPARLAQAFERLFAGAWKRGTVPPRWDGQAGARIVAALADHLRLAA